MRHKCLIKMLESMKFNVMGYSSQSVEADVYNYIQQKITEGKLNVYFVPTLHMKAHLFGSLTCANVPNVTNYY